MNDGKPDLYEVLDYYGWEQRSQGSGWRTIKCKLHGDRSASARVNYDEGRLRCFACSFHGDVYDIIQKEEDVDFHAARRIGQERFGASGTGIRGRAGRQSGRGVSGSARHRTLDSAYVPPRLRPRTDAR